MTYHLAQLNIARFRLPPDHPDNLGFVNNLDKINALAEQQMGFVWRRIGEGNDALDVQAYDDPYVISNMSLWADIESLSAFVYRNKEHREIMRRGAEWFDNIEFYLVLWWVEEGHIPSLYEAKARLSMLEEKGPTEKAFTFKSPFSVPSGKPVKPVLGEHA